MSERHSNGEGENNGGRTDTLSFARVRRIFYRIKEAWLTVVSVISWVMTRAVALLVYLVGFVPYGITMRLFRFDPLDRDLDQDRESYWEEVDMENHDLDAFRNQY